jgi:hypothetical protein
MRTLLTRLSSSGRTARAALAAAALLACLVPRSALACSVCLAGDPVFANHGASAQAEGDLSLFVQLQAFEKTAGALPHHDEDPGEPEAHEEVESAQDQRLDVYLAWSPLDRVTLTLDLPFAFNEIHESAEKMEASGVGDVALAGSVVAWRDREVLPSAWIEARAFLKAPTGDTDRDHDGEIDPHLQPGTGSWDYGVGLAGAKRFARGALYASALYRGNGSGDFGHHEYAYGDAVLATLASELPVGHAFGSPALEFLTFGAQLDFRWAERDVADGEPFEHSGGSILYATPSLRVRLPFAVAERPAALRAAVQIPLTNAWLHGNQREDEVWSIGLYLPL